MCIRDSYRPAGEKRQLLYVATERLMFCVLAYDQTSGAIATRAMGDLSNTIGRPCEHGLIGEVDPECRLIGSQAYDGLFKVVPMDRAGQLREAFDVRLEELNVVDVKFMHGCATPTICVLYEDTKEARHVKTYEVDVKEKTLRDGPLTTVEGGWGHRRRVRRADQPSLRARGARGDRMGGGGDGWAPV